VLTRIAAPVDQKKEEKKKKVEKRETKKKKRKFSPFHQTNTAVFSSLF
jgi:hypothetical protein